MNTVHGHESRQKYLDFNNFESFSFKKQGETK